MLDLSDHSGIGISILTSAAGFLAYFLLHVCRKIENAQSVTFIFTQFAREMVENSVQFSILLFPRH